MIGGGDDHGPSLFDIAEARKHVQSAEAKIFTDKSNIDEREDANRVQSAIKDAQREAQHLREEYPHTKGKTDAGIDGLAEVAGSKGVEVRTAPLTTKVADTVSDTVQAAKDMVQGAMSTIGDKISNLTGTEGLSSDDKAAAAASSATVNPPTLADTKEHPTDAPATEKFTLGSPGQNPAELEATAAAAVEAVATEKTSTPAIDAASPLEENKSSVLGST